ncbi:MAG: sensor histidine kinase [Clostridiales bacterium]|nr:sensor histidine kinase [Clostridiales bacterium]
MRRNRMASITAQVRRSVTSIAVLLAVPALIGLAVMMMYSSRTQAMIRRMDAAARMKPVLESTISENLFSVAAGRISFKDSGVEELITETDKTLDMLLGETQGSGQMQLTIARRTMDTLEQYAYKVRDGMASGTPIIEVEGIVDEVRNVGRLVADMLDAFTTDEIANATVASRRLRTIVTIAAVTEILLLLFAFIRTRNETRRLTSSIHTEIYSLEETVRRIAEGNFGDRVRDMNVVELKELGEQINQMADRLETLIEQVRQKQDNLARAELRTLQAQINPHFLYNTLDTIVWQAESGKGDEVVRLTRNLSDFFRISLSSGADWIPVSQELKHVSAYLSIQKTRYRDILDYEVDQPEGLEEIYMLKLLLQPLVENALYHGIKNKRGGGKIQVRVKYQNGLMTFIVADTGKGMTPEQLKELEESLRAEIPTAQAAQEPGHSGFGMRNVDMRIRLYYRKQRGLVMHSGPEGTEISFTIPIRTREEIDHDESLSRG